MFQFTSNNADDLYKEILSTIVFQGWDTEPRGFKCKELSPCCCTLLEPQKNIIMNPVRKMSLGFAAAELTWIMTGREDVAFISQYNKKIADYSDDGIKFFGAYGPKVSGQLQYILDTLTKDPWSRQAVLNIWRENPGPTKDVPCTVMMQFIRRPLNTLNMMVYMRSQDVWLGFPYDLHNFTSMQIIVANMLGLNVGHFALMQGSLHAYAPDLEKINLAMTMKLTECVGAAETPLTLNELVLQKMRWMHEHLLKKV